MRRVALALLAGAALGAASRVEEVTRGFSLGLSSNGTWLALSFAFGLLVARRPREAAVLGAVSLTAANGGYYLWVALTEPGTPLSAVAGSPLRWVVIGVGGGVVFGPAGWVARHGVAAARSGGAAGHEGDAGRGGGRPSLDGALRVVAVLLLAGVLLVDGSSALRGGRATDGIGLLAGLALPALVPVGARLRGAGVAAALVTLAVACTGALDALSP